MDRRHALLLAGVVALVCFALGAELARRWSRLRARRLGRAYNLRGQRGERAAERLLSDHGYTLLARQVETRYPVELDGEAIEVPLHADFLVSRGGRTLVAEVKTGRHAPRFQHAETRRQLLEYQLAFAADAVLLVDVEASDLREVRFPLSDPPERGRTALWPLACALLALGAAYWWAQP